MIRKSPLADFGAAARAEREARWAAIDAENAAKKAQCADVVNRHVVLIAGQVAWSGYAKSCADALVLWQEESRADPRGITVAAVNLTTGESLTENFNA